MVNAATQMVARRFQEFFRNSVYLAFDNRDHSGYWRFLTVRTTELGHVMIIVSMCPQQLAEEEVDQVKKGR